MEVVVKFANDISYHIRVRKKSRISLSGAQSTAQRQQNQELIVDFRKKEAKTHTPVSWGGADEQFQAAGNQHHKEHVVVISHLHPG